MSLLAHIFNENEIYNQSFQDFWEWFIKQESDFYDIIDKEQQTESGFFEKMAIALSAITKEIFLLTGKKDDNTAEIIFTAEGNPLYIPFIEMLVATAPTLHNWQFTALKSAFDNDDMRIQMGDLDIAISDLSFIPNVQEEYPDAISLSIIHAAFTEENRDESMTASFIFLDNYLGELTFLNAIDNVNILLLKDVKEPLIPISKLKDYLLWREKEFVEKYQTTMYNSSEDKYALLEAETEDGTAVVAVVNADLLKWDGMVSHPWMGVFEIQYESNTENGMPSPLDNDLLDQIEDEMLLSLKEEEGYQFIGRQTGIGKRLLYLAFKEFRKPAVIFDRLYKQHATQFKISMEIYKDKYWRTVEKFMQ